MNGFEPLRRRIIDYTDAGQWSEVYDGPIEGCETEQLKVENAQLRELVALWIVIDKHMSLCATTDCGQCPVREECGESVYLEGLLGIDPKGLSWRVQERMAETADVQVENAALRELINIIAFCTNDEAHDCDKCAINGTEMNVTVPEWLFCDSLIERLRTLGFEVKE